MNYLDILPTDILLQIYDYTYRPHMKLKSWIPENKLTISLSKNPNAIDYLEINKEQISWKFLSINPNSIQLLKKNSNLINWDYLEMNPNIEEIILELLNTIEPLSEEYKILQKMYIYILNCKEKSKKIIITEHDLLDNSEFNILRWAELSRHPEIIEIIEKDYDKISKKINWNNLSVNSNPKIISFIEKNLDKVDLSYLSLNENAIHILERNIDNPKINWNFLSNNENAIHLLKRYPEKINWTIVSSLKNAVEPLLKDNLDKINWSRLSSNPNIFEIDFKATREKAMIWITELLHKSTPK
jgi:hypothetical protein